MNYFYQANNKVMKAVKYIRTSTEGQNNSVQRLKHFDDGTRYLEVIDVCSGAIPFSDREQAPSVLKMANKGDIDTLIVHSIDRLGRNTLDILQTIQTLTKMGVNVKAEREGLETLLPDGKENPTAKLMVNIMATLAEFERDRLTERRMEGIKRAKERGAYSQNGGNRKPLSVKEFFNKAKNSSCLKELKKGESLRRAAKLSGVSLGTAQKVNKLATENGML